MSTKSSWLRPFSVLLEPCTRMSLQVFDIRDLTANKNLYKDDIQLRNFEYGRLNLPETFSGPLQVKKKDVWAVLYLNYLVWWKPDKKTPTPKDLQYPEDLVNLSRITDVEEIRYMPDGSFTLPTPLKAYTFSIKDEEAGREWVKILKERARALVPVPIASLGDSEAKIREIQQVFFPKMTWSSTVRGDRADKWISDIINLRAKYIEYEPYIMKTSLFVETRFAGASRGFIEWFTGSDSPRMHLAKSEEAVVSSWKDAITSTVQELQFVGEEKFFREDTEALSRACEDCVFYVDAWNRYHREVSQVVGFKDQYRSEQEVYKKFMAAFQKFPPLHTISFKDFKGGEINGYGHTGIDAWTYVPNGAVYCLRGNKTWPYEFVCKGGENSSRSAGMVLWNERSWVWVHPSIKHVVRFNWNPASQLFSFHTAKLRPDVAAKVKTPPFTFGDWQYDPKGGNGGGGQLRYVHTPKAIKQPPITNWEMKGSVPPPVALIACMCGQLIEFLESHGIRT
eukprot:TRINITY_DN840_c0_g1_i4.p1 TRINITY_DN840_c0_g1~~TRINITY_DN840_c0_g1_i4.p1  ORF type:complete len:508 (-),score=123.50 TRINITY_DN840_c0_g1_i4:83-1606(-)